MLLTSLIRKLHGNRIPTQLSTRLSSWESAQILQMKDVSVLLTHYCISHSWDIAQNSCDLRPYWFLSTYCILPLATPCLSFGFYVCVWVGLGGLASKLTGSVRSLGNNIAPILTWGHSSEQKAVTIYHLLTHNSSLSRHWSVKFVLLNTIDGNFNEITVNCNVLQYINMPQF